MKPKKLVICAWGPYRDKVEIDFAAFEQSGIFLITGATGAGKTTIFDAITYALYGALSGDERDKERSGVRSDFAEGATPTFVELTMEHGGAVYKIRRNPEYLRPKKRGSGAEFTKEKENAILYYPDERVLEGVREVNAALQELLVLDYQQFKKISMIAQGEFARLLVAPPREKTKIFREIFGTGVYERFTAGLGGRSRELYGRVMTAKTKLREDVKLITDSLGKSSWAEGRKADLGALVQGENWNYEEVLKYLGEMEAEASALIKTYHVSYEQADKKVEAVTAKLIKQQEVNQLYGSYEKNREELAKLEEQSDEINVLEETYRRAHSIQFIVPLWENCKQLDKRLQETISQGDILRKQLEKLEEESASLQPVVAGAGRIRELLEVHEKLRELIAELEAAEKVRQKKKAELARGQQQYQQKDEMVCVLREQLTEVERRRSLAAIGLAASLLEEGKPCPVCGSLTHPAPCKVTEALISREELEERKLELSRQEEELKLLHGQLVALRTLVDSEQERKAEQEGKVEEYRGILEQEQDELCKDYLTLAAEVAKNRLEQQCHRAGEIAGLMQEKEGNHKRLREQQEKLQEEGKAAENTLAEALSAHGFADVESYEAEKKTAAECDAMQQELEHYKNRVSACKELQEHLEASLQGRKAEALWVLEEELAEAKQQKTEALKEQQIWERQKTEVTRTIKLMKHNLQEIAAESEKYGYVKDLENMANGNNGKRLVFEQYVLAGYFEEILKAANLRFSKMTSGRYEMYRVGEVGDGRVKDNLEIQVMDYYTGKMRSVRTLSGGESFKASLSLALGMSDVIQAMNGGIRVDTLFVDEGFGALDSESLDQACDTLMGLVEKNHMIGIISHVPQLRERIREQLVIEKTNSGSRVTERIT